MFLKSMQMCKVVEIIPARRKKDAPDYIVQRLDSEKQLYASEDGLSSNAPERDAETLPETKAGQDACR